MENQLQVFNYCSNEVRTIERKGEYWFVLADVCKILDLQNPTMVAKKLDVDERAKSDLGLQERNVTIINESGLYSVILRSDKPQAKPFRKWVTSEVLPTIRRTGNYSVKNDSLDNKTKLADAKLRNSKARQASVFVKLAQMTDNNTYKQVLLAKSAQVLNNGNMLLPLPEIEQRTYSAEEIGKKLGISANMVGRLAKQYDLKTSLYGRWVWDKSRYSNKQVQTFRYYGNIIDKINEILLYNRLLNTDNANYNQQ